MSDRIERTRDAPVRSILVTGGAGFIGIATANALAAAGHKVRVLDPLDPQTHGPAAKRPGRLVKEIEFVHGDIRDTELLAHTLRRIDVVFHFASLTGTAQSAYESRRYVDVNGSGTASLWDTIINQRLSLDRVILASSRAVYGEGAYDCLTCGRVAPPARGAAQLDAGRWEPVCPSCGGPLRAVPTPEAFAAPTGSVYATTKLLQEQLCRHGSEATGIPTVVLRYFNVIGPHQSMRNSYCGIASVFCARLLAGAPIQLYEDGAIERDFITVADVARANLLALDLPRKSICLNVGSGRPTRIAELATTLCRMFGVPPRLQVTGFSRLGDIRRCIADTEAASQAMGFHAEPRLEEALADLVAWARLEGTTDGYDAMLTELETRSVLRRRGRVPR